MPGGTTIVKMDNEHILNVSMDELPEDLKTLVETAIEEYRNKCLLCFTKTRDQAVIQKTRLPRTLLDGQRDGDAVAEHRLMVETISKTMADTLANHNEVFINSVTNAMKEALYGAPISQRGLAYTNQMTQNRQAGSPATHGGQAGSSGQGGCSDQPRDADQNMQHSVQ